MSSWCDGRAGASTLRPSGRSRPTEDVVLIVDRVTEEQVVAPSTCTATDPQWRLTSGGEPRTVAP